VSSLLTLIYRDVECQLLELDNNVMSIDDFSGPGGPIGPACAYAYRI